MGLDMAIYGRRTPVGLVAIPPDEQHPQFGAAVAALAEHARHVADEGLAYWRQHANLHGFIVQTYGGSIDQCQEIPLTLDNVKAILQATQVAGGAGLPHTDGFFFGSSSGNDEELAADKDQLTKVLEWMVDPDPDEIRTVFYQASW